MNTLHKLLAVSAVSLLTACSGAPERGTIGSGDPEVTEDTAPGIGGGSAGQQEGVEVLPAGGTQVDGQDISEGQTLTDEMKMVDVDTLYEPVIYFGYDQYELDDQATDIVRHHADILMANPTQIVILNGHTDERGTPEYNLALGERRAKAVAEAMMLFGVAADRIEVISFGEEKPADARSNEAAWQKNRRVEIVIQ